MTTDAGGIFTSDGNRIRYHCSIFDGVFFSFYRANCWEVDVSLGEFHGVGTGVLDRTRCLPLERFGQSSSLGTPGLFCKGLHMSSVMVVSVMVIGFSFILCNSCGPPKALRLKAVLSTRISVQSSDMAAARDGRRTMRDERAVGGCGGSRMMLVGYRIGGSKAEKVRDAEAAGSRTRSDEYRKSVNYELGDNGS